MKLHLKKLRNDDPLFVQLAEQYLKIGATLVDAVNVNQWLNVLITIDGKEELWHLSVSHPRRYPTWDEIKEIRYALLPPDKTFGVLLPPMDEYVNLHKNCFHLWEIQNISKRLIQA